MACLLSLASNERIYLKDYHSFGRLAYSVTTLLDKPNVSRIHAVIEWQDEAWIIRDLSSNGLWLNDKHLKKDQPYPLKSGDKLCFAKDPGLVYQVLDLAPPQDLLLKIDHAQIIDALPLQHYNLLPDEQAPQVVLYFDGKRRAWFLEPVDSEQPSQQALNENDHFEINHAMWQLQLRQHTQATEAINPAAPDIASLCFEFELSLDEESTRLVVATPDDSIDLDYRSHHYLTLNLARYKYADQAKGLDPAEQGWIYSDIMAKELGIDLNHLNIQIHRARKQLADAFAGQISTDEIIQRRAGKIRFGASQFRITKGQQLECQQLQNELSSNQRSQQL